MTSSPDFDHWPAQLEPLYVPVPQNLAPLLGYEGECRFVAFFWNQTVDELAYHDGCSRGAGKSLRFLAYAGHPHVEAELSMDFGLQDGTCPHWLLLDTTKDMLYAGPPDEILALLMRQHDVDPRKLDEQRFETTEAVHETLESDDPELEALEDYLDRWSAGDTA